MKSMFVAAALLAAASTPAAQGAILVTWTGTIANGIDDANIFGHGTGSDLTGRSFTATFLVDPTVGFIQTSPGFFSTEGANNGFPSPLLQADLTINGFTFAFESTSFGGYRRDARPGRSEIYTEADTTTDILFLTEFRFDNSIPFTGLDENLSIDVAGRGVFQAFLGGNRLFAGNFAPTHVTIAPDTAVASVPEPGSGVLAMAGLSVAAFLRRRKIAAGEARYL